MKTVFSSNETLCHIFASQSQSFGKANNMHFTDSEIYSYRTKIGQLHGSFLFLHSNNFSTTTSKHKCNLRRACSHFTIISTPFLDSYENTFAYQVEKINEAKKELTRVRSLWKFDHLVGEISKQVEILTRFQTEFNAPGEIPANFSEIEISGMRTKVAETVKKSEENREARERIKVERALFNFRAGEALTHAEKNILSNTGLAYIRLKDAETVETSKGIKLTLNVFMGYFFKFVNGRLNQGTKILESFTVGNIDQEKIQIGCHTFKRTEIFSFVETLERK